MPQYGWTCQKLWNPPEIMLIYYQSTGILGLSKKVVNRVECVWIAYSLQAIITASHLIGTSLIFFKLLMSTSIYVWVSSMVSPPAFDDGLQGQQVLSCDGVDIFVYIRSCIWELVVSGSQLDPDDLVVSQLEPDWSSARKPVCITFTLQSWNNRSTTCPET